MNKTQIAVKERLAKAGIHARIEADPLRPDCYRLLDQQQRPNVQKLNDAQFLLIRAERGEYVVRDMALAPLVTPADLPVGARASLMTPDEQRVHDTLRAHFGNIGRVEELPRARFRVHLTSGALTPGYLDAVQRKTGYRIEPFDEDWDEAESFIVDTLGHSRAILDDPKPDFEPRSDDEDTKTDADESEDTRNLPALDWPLMDEPSVQMPPGNEAPYRALPPLHFRFMDDPTNTPTAPLDAGDPQPTDADQLADALTCAQLLRDLNDELRQQLDRAHLVNQAQSEIMRDFIAQMLAPHVAPPDPVPTRVDVFTLEQYLGNAKAMMDADRELAREISSGWKQLKFTDGLGDEGNTRRITLIRDLPAEPPPQPEQRAHAEAELQADVLDASGDTEPTPLIIDHEPLGVFARNRIDATRKYLDYVRRTGNTSGAEDAVGDQMRDVDFEEVARVLGLKLERTTFDKPIPQEFAYVMASGYEVTSWSPGAAGEGIHVTQVHILLPIGDSNAKLVLRIKSAVACDQLIRILQEHREFVWGKAT